MKRCVFISLLIVLALIINSESKELKKKKKQGVGKMCSFPFENKCDPGNKYRSLDGTCNNLINGWWGKSSAPYKRWLIPDYADDLNKPRVAKDKSELPSAKKISCMYHTENNLVDRQISHLFMQWGLFISIDLSRFAKPNQNCSACIENDKCYPISIDDEDICPTMQKTKKCIEFTRSANAFNEKPECKREQINLQTSFLDGSVIYGIDEATSKKLRDPGIKGALKMTTGIHGLKNENLPIENRESPCLSFRNQNKCFAGGDDRLSMIPGFAALQTIFVREHNRIADILSNLNSFWDSDTVFEETRRVIIAIIQHITYSEYLPILLSKQTLNKYNLLSNGSRPYVYDPNIDPRIANEFSTSAGRFGHSLVRSKTSIRDNFYRTRTPDHHLHDDFFTIKPFYNKTEGGLESILRGYLSDPLMKVDRFMSSEVTQHLFDKPDPITKRPSEADLAALNIQRGRDHGIPGYINLREFCSLSSIDSWDDLSKEMPSDAIQILRTLYKDVEDIDLFTAAITEFPLKGSLVGPTLNCLIGLQFRELKFGDRFWYETSDAVVGFTSEQLNEIRKVSLSNILCKNMIDTPLIPPEAFILNNIASNNFLVICSNFPDIDWGYWIDKKVDSTTWFEEFLDQNQPDLAENLIENEVNSEPLENKISSSY